MHKFFFEQRSYPSSELQEYFQEIKKELCIRQPNGTEALDCVGHFYCASKKTSVFILPKVLDSKDGVDITVNPDDAAYKFLSSLAMWQSSAIARYRRTFGDNGRDFIAPEAKNFERGKISPSLFDVKNAMEAFFYDNQNLFVFTIKNKLAGNRKINWQKTISKKTPFFQGETLIYMELINKHKAFDLDDRLLVLYFSAMNYIHEKFGIDMPKSEYYVPMRLREFERLIGHRGLVELRRIKYKYFADKFLALYKIMEAFFKWGLDFQSNNLNQEYLLTNKFNNVFEAMIDDLVSDRAYDSMKHQSDDKRMDHLYKEKSLIFADQEQKELMWHIGDSKYYKDENEIIGHSVAKQYTYAKNLIQDFFSPEYFKNHEPNARHEGVRYRDDLTEGYNITPNFFIRGYVDERTKLKPDTNSFNDGINLKLDDAANEKYWNIRNRHFENRLFDRDTLLLQVYDVNFLYVLRAYTSPKSAIRDAFKQEAREKFRANFIRLLNDKYYFWAVLPNGACLKKTSALSVDLNTEFKGSSVSDDIKAFLWIHSRILTGKIFHTGSSADYLVLALERESVNMRDDAFKRVHDGVVDDCEVYSVHPAEIWDDAIKTKQACDKESWL